MGRRILIAEDEMIVALFLEDVLTELGYEVAGVVSRIDEAMARADDGTYDVAILDVHLNGKDVFPFADRLTESGIPFVFATGYGEQGLPERYRAMPTLQKPFRPEDLADTIERLTAPRPA